MGAAVDVVGDAGDVARLLPTEEGDEVGDVVDVAATADRDLGDERRLTFACKAPPVMSVSMKPGATELTVTPFGPSSRASARANPSSAAFAAEHAMPPNTPPPRSAETEDRKTMRPKPCSTMTGATRRVML